MILGLGNDLIEIERIRLSIERHGLHFLNRLFTRKEQDYCYRFDAAAPHFAGRFAAKEALAKAFGTGFGPDLSWLELEILSDERGKPVVFLSSPLQQRYENPRLFVAISHCNGYALATAIWEQ